MIRGLSIDATVNLPPESPAWVAINEENGNNIGIDDRGSDKPAICIFTKAEDARHYARLLRDNGPKDRLVDIKEVPLHPFIKAVAEKGQMTVIVIGPNEAMEFFKGFDSLWEYFEFL